MEGRKGSEFMQGDIIGNGVFCNLHVLLAVVGLGFLFVVFSFVS